jgi:hypothetical protein
MPLQNLTPQLRTRLNRMERAVGWFIMAATFLLVFGFGYYIYHAAETKGWFAEKARYYTYARTAIGLAVGDHVKLLGFDVGQITRIVPMPAWGGVVDQNVYVEFVVINDKEQYSGYLLTEGSRVKFADSGFLGNRQLDLTRGTGGYGTYINYSVQQSSLPEIKAAPNLEKLRLGEEIYEGTNLALKAWQPVSTNLDRIAALGRTNLWVIDRTTTNHSLTAMWNAEQHHYEPVTKASKYGLSPEEPPALTDRMQSMVAQIQSALPGILNLTNQISTVLSNTTVLTSNLSIVSQDARVAVTNLAVITTQLRNPEGSLGEWLIPTNLNLKLDRTLESADGTVSNLNTNLITLNLTLVNLANITSNLNNQVQANTNILSNVSGVVVHSDEFIQGLKRFWLFKHLFATHPAKTKDQHHNAPQPSPKERKP